MELKVDLDALAKEILSGIHYMELKERYVVDVPCNIVCESITWS